MTQMQNYFGIRLQGGITGFGTARKKYYSFLLSLIMTCFLTICFGCGKEAPRASSAYTTKGNLYSIKVSILMYKDEVGAWPKKFSDLKEYSEYLSNGDEFNKTKDAFHDAWNNPIVFLPISDTNPKIKLISYGRDGKTGGTGKDADIIFEIDPKLNSKD